jgi:TolB-like protein
MNGAGRAAALLWVGLMLFAWGGTLPAGADPEATAGGSDTAVTAALAGIENVGGDPRHDYLAGIVEGLLLFDLSRVPEITLVNRSRLRDVLEEQRLALSGITEERARELGSLLGAGYLLHGSYVFLGDEALFTLTVTSVESGTARTVSSRGATENTVHELAEQAAALIGGGRYAFKSEGASRSILSMRDERPGEIALYSNLVDAEIYLDGEFVGYTTGDPRKPFVIEGVAPGFHRLRTALGGDFGVVKLPELSFHDWSARLRVGPGERRVVRAGERHFNDFIYGLIYLASESETLYAGRREEWNWQQDYAFTDRSGAEHRGSVRLAARFSDGKGRVTARLEENGVVRVAVLEPGKEELRLSAGPVELLIEQRVYDERSCRVSARLKRTDLQQGMHRQEGKQPPLFPVD